MNSAIAFTLSLEGVRAGIKQATTDQNGAYSIKLSSREDIYHYYAVYFAGDYSDTNTNGYASAIIVAQGNHQLQENIKDVKATVNSLSSAFLPGTKSGTLTILNADELLLNYGQYGRAATLLNTKLLPQIDGCANGGTAHSADWVRTCTAQDKLYQPVKELAAGCEVLTGVVQQT